MTKLDKAEVTVRQHACLKERKEMKSDHERVEKS